MPRHGSPGLGESLLRNSVSELSDSLTEFVDTAIQLEDRLIEPEDSPQASDSDVQSRLWRRCPTREGAAVWGAIGVLSLISIYFTVTGDVQRVLDAVRDLGFFGGVVLVLVYAVCMVIMVPGTILNVGAGFLYGTFWGYIVTILGCMLGAVLCFALGRGVLQSWVRGKVAEHGPVGRLCKLMGASQMTQRETFTIVLVSRLPPVMPFALTNYAFSITDVSFPVFFFGSLLGVTPACILDAYIGSLCDSLSAILEGEAEDSDDSTSGSLRTAKNAELIFGVVLTIFATTVLVVYGNRIYDRFKLQSEIDEEQPQAQNSSLQEQQHLASRPASPAGAHVQDHQPGTLVDADDSPAAVSQNTADTNRLGTPGNVGME